MQKFKINQKVEVINSLHGHLFNIGEVVEILYYDGASNNGEGDYKCFNGTDTWYLTEQELQEITTELC